MTEYAECEESAVMASFLRLEKSQAEMRVVLDRLLDRLAPVMRPNMPEGANLLAAEQRERQSPVVELVQEAITRTQVATEMVAAATVALEV